MPEFLWLHEQQHDRLPCPSLSPGVCLNSCPLCWWCHPTISSSVTPFYSCLQSFPASGSLPMSQQEYWSGLLFSSPRDLPDPGIKPGYPSLQADSLPSEPPGQPMKLVTRFINLDLGMHIVSKHLPAYPRLSINLSQWSLSRMEYSFWTVIHQILFLLCKLPYNKPTHWFYEADCLIFWFQDGF